MAGCPAGGVASSLVCSEGIYQTWGIFVVAVSQTGLPQRLLQPFIALILTALSCPSLPRRGDLSDEFRLASFFPQLLHPPIDRLAGACTRLTGLGAAAGSQQHQAAWRSALVGGAALPGSLDVADDAARRRWARILYGVGLPPWESGRLNFLWGA